MLHVELFKEAYRNVSTGTSRAVSLCLVFLLSVGLLAVVHTHETVSVSQRALEFKSSGAATYMLTSEQNIDPISCESLSRSTGVVASGSLSRVAPQRLALLPQWEIPAWSVSPGMSAVFSVSTITTDLPNVWVSQRLANILGVALGESLVKQEINLENESPSTLVVSGIFDYPDDGRDQMFAESMLFPSVTTDSVDHCLGIFWPDQELATSMLGLTLVSPAVSGAGSASDIQQVNSRFGIDFEYALPIALFWRIGSLIFGLLVPITLLRPRRLEFASSLHAGLRPRDLFRILSIEWLFCILPACSVITVSVVGISILNNPDPPGAALEAGLLTLLSGVCASFIGVTGYAVTARETKLFALFKTR